LERPDKVVYSRTLEAPSTARTRIERDFDVAVVRQLKSTASSDLSVGGAELAGRAIVAGLVDELQLLLVPVLVGGGKRALPEGSSRSDLELLVEGLIGIARTRLGVILAEELRRHGRTFRKPGCLKDRRDLRVRREALPARLVPVEDRPKPVALIWIPKDVRPLATMLLSFLSALG
jgi:hypothetical protein